jgi:hypothetical protein
MGEARPGICARQGRAEARGKAGQMREARQGRCVTQGRGRQLRDTRPGRCARQRMAGALSKDGQMR